MNTPGNFELAKLLKEKGFDNYTPLKYFSKKPSGYGITNWSENIAYSCEDIYSQLRLGYNEQTYFIWAPTIAEVVMWLYEKHGIWIYPRQSSARLGFRCFIQRLRILGETDIQNDEVYESPTEAYEAAITYTLTNLI